MSSPVVGTPRLSKSQFLIGRQCRRRLWLRSRGIEEPPVESEAVWDIREAEGARVEEIAARLFPGSVRIVKAAEEDEVNERTDGFAERLQATQTAMAEAPAILQAHFADGPVVAVVDILERRDGTCFLWEVKASTSLKPIFDWDLAFQVLVARRAGLDVAGCGVLHLDASYELADEPVAPRALLAREDRTAAVEALMDDVSAEVEKQLASLAAADRPEAIPSAHCKASRKAKEGNRPSDCGHLGSNGECGKLLPDHWAGRLPRLQGAKAQHVRDMADPDMRHLDPDDATMKWTGEQVRAIRAAREGQPQIDASALRAELDKLTWPVAYMDFEFDTGMAVPRFPGCRPYDRLPFQWAVVIQPREGADIEKPEPFLFDADADPQRPFLETLLDSLPAEGSLVVHEETAERTVLNQLADRLGGDLADRARALIPRLYDTKRLLQAGYYHPDQQGSYSIKRVAGPMLGRAYDDLDIKDGMAAVAGWKDLLRAESEEERDALRKKLVAYCDRDATLMHEIVEEARRLTR